MPTATMSPTAVIESIHDAAATMKRSFEVVGSLNREAPMPERNAVVHLGAALLRRDFAVYAEASFSESQQEVQSGSAKRGRVDLLAADGRTALVVEVKTFGKRRFDVLLDDLRRVMGYRPETDRRTRGVDPVEFWTGSQDRWGLVLVQSFTTNELNDAWCSQIGLPAAFSAALDSRTSGVSRYQKAHFREFARLLTEQHAEVGKVLVCNAEKELWDCAPLHLLWAAVPLET